MEAFAQIILSIWVWLQPLLSSAVVVIILAGLLWVAWEEMIAKLLIDPAYNWLTGLTKQPWYVRLAEVIKKAQPILIALCAVFISLNSHVDLNAVFGGIIPANLADEQTQKIAFGLMWALSSNLVHLILTAIKNAGGTQAQTVSSPAAGSGPRVPIPGLSGVTRSQFAGAAQGRDVG